MDPQPAKAARSPGLFDAETFLDSAGIARRIVEFRAHAVVFSQGDPSDTVMYVQKGGVQLSVVSETGKQAIVATLGPGEFFGEGALAGQPVRMGTASATVATTVLVIEKQEMMRVLH
jgi:CRP/FNR family cyclic AMP-dependent transcriptional regulator